MESVVLQDNVVCVCRLWATLGSESFRQEYDDVVSWTHHVVSDAYMELQMMAGSYRGCVSSQEGLCCVLWTLVRSGVDQTVTDTGNMRH